MRNKLASLFVAGAVAGAAVMALTGCNLPLSGREEEGQYVYQVHCSQCHESNDLGLKSAPPRLEGLFRHPVLPDGVTPANDETVRQVIVHGKRTMPAFDQRLSDQQLADLLLYLRKK